jgi:hypothetical protein
MKKLMMVMVISVAIIAGGVFAFADERETNECLLSDEDIAIMTEVKTVFLNEKVSEGLVTEAEAAAILENLAQRSGQSELRDLAFGRWLRTSEYAEVVSDIMPHKNEGTKGKGQSFKGQGRGQGRGMGNGLGTCVNP